MSSEAKEVLPLGGNWTIFGSLSMGLLVPHERPHFEGGIVRTGECCRATSNQLSSITSIGDNHLSSDRTSVCKMKGGKY